MLSKQERIVPEPAAGGKTSRSLRTIRLAWFALGLGLAILAVVQGWRFLTRDMIDFSVVYRVGERILRGPVESIYDFSDGIMLFKYAPIIGYVLTPLAFLPKHASALGFFILSVASFVACYRMTYRWVIPHSAKGWAPLIVVVLTILSTLRVIMNSLDFGQVHVFVLLGMLFAWHAFESKKWIRGALVLSLLTLSKIVPAVLCLPWLIRRQWRPAIATAAISLGLLILPAMWLGPSRTWDITLAWWNVLHVTTNQSMIERWTNQSLLSALARILAPNHYHVQFFNGDMQHVILLTKIILALGLGLILWLGARRNEEKFPSVAFARTLELSYYLIFIILAFPLAWRYHFTAMIVPNMLVLSYLLCTMHRDRVTWGIFIAALFLSSVVNQEILGSRLFEWFHVRSCLTLSAILMFVGLLRVDKKF